MATGRASRACPASCAMPPRSQITGERQSHWRLAAPAGLSLEWDVEITDSRPNEQIAWRTADGASLTAEGVVRFRTAPGNRGTQVIFDAHFRPPGGELGKTLAQPLADALGTKLGNDLRRFKQLVELGEIVHSDDSIIPGPNPAQPPREMPSAVRTAGEPRLSLGDRRVDPSCSRSSWQDARTSRNEHPRRTTMKATCWNAPNTVAVEEVPDPRILNSQDAIVKITSTAICGSDLHLLQAYIPAMLPGDILGHEFMGEVVEVGPSVSKLKVGDRVVVPFPIACGVCFACQKGMYSVCENSNPNAWMAEQLFGHPIAGVFGYSHLTGGYAGGQAEYARVPFADVGPLKVPQGMTDEQVLFLSDILPTGYMGAEMCDIQRGDTIAVWGCGPVGQFAIASAYLLGAERVIAIDRFPYRLEMARDKAGAETLNYEEVDVLDALKEMTGGRGPDACIDAVGMEAHGHGPLYAFDRAMHAARMETDRPIALREAIKACRNGGIVSVIGVYGGYIDRFPMGAVMNRSLTIKSGQCHVQRYMQPLLEHIQNGDLDPTFIITHTLPLEQAPHGYDLFKNKRDHCEKVVLKA